MQEEVQKRVTVLIFSEKEPNFFFVHPVMNF